MPQCLGASVCREGLKVCLNRALEAELHPDLNLPRPLGHRRLPEVGREKVAAVAAVVHAVEQVVGGDEEFHHVLRIEGRVAASTPAAAGTATTATSTTAPAALTLRQDRLSERRTTGTGTGSTTGAAATRGSARSESTTARPASATRKPSTRALTAKRERATHAEICRERCCAARGV